jgi:long-chain acyl-CoA synthetase
MEVTTAERYASGGPGKPLLAENLALAFKETVARGPDEPAIEDPAREVELTYSELADKVARIAGGFAELGVQKGDTVALLLNNRWEFIPTDLAVVSLGGVPFSIYQTLSPEQIAYVCGDAGCKVAVVEGMFLENFEAARKDLPNVETVIVVDGEGGDMTFDELMDKGGEFDAGESAGNVGPDDLLTLIYTSGTTGPPKGVQLSHRNLMGLISGVEDLIELPEKGGKVISWLPAAHIAERGANYYLPLTKGFSVTICPDPRKVVEFLPQVNPTWFFAVPRIWEKLKAGLEAMTAKLPDEQREPAQKALEAAVQKVRLQQAGEEVPDELAKAVAQADEQMFANLRKMLGLDEAIAVNVGAAPTPVEVLEFFHAIGIEIGELWGMSETCGVATCNPPDRVKLGTVGPPIPGVEIKLGEDGEVFVKGDSNMVGYRNMPDKTSETIDEEGWLATGDIGELDADGYLKIVDRKKELIINAAGKNMSPAEIEAKVKSASPLIGQAIAIGDGRKYNVALVTLDPDVAPGWAEQQGIEDASFEAMAQNEKVIAAVQAGIDQANERMARVEQIKKFKILPTDWEPGGDELTPTMKLKRKPINEKYASEIEELYAD